MKRPIISLLGMTATFLLVFGHVGSAQYYRPNPDAQKRFAINYNEAGIPAYTLPDPLATDVGKPVSGAKMWWEERRIFISAQADTM